MKGAIKDHAIEDVWSKPSKERHSIKLASAQKFTSILKSYLKTKRRIRLVPNSSER